MESKKINQLATELAPELSDLTIIGDPTTGISKKITLSQMASLFTGTVEEYASLSAFPLVGTADTIYIALDTNIIYRWNTGTSAYVELSPNIVTSLVFNDANGFDGTISLVGSTATLTITTALTQGSVGFIGASGALTQDNSNFYWDNTNKRLGINTNAPTTAIDAFGSGIIGRLNGTSTNNAFLGFASAGSNKWSIGNVQSDHRFRIYSEGNATELVSVLQTGEFGIGIANPTTKLHIDGGASALIANLDANVSVAKSISFRSDNSARINLEVSGTESGSNAGANLFIRTYTDAGSLLATPLTITRSTGAATFSSSVSTNGPINITVPYSASTMTFLTQDNLGNGIYLAPRSNLNFDYGVAGNTTGIINQFGYQNGSAHFRSLQIGNGKGGSIAFFDGTTGNVGIGSTTSSSTTTPVTLSMGGTYGTTILNGIKIKLYDDGTTIHGLGVISGNLYLNATDGATNITLNTNNTERIRITSGGITQINGTNGGVRLTLQNTDNAGYLAFTEQEIKMWRPNGSGANLTIATQAISGSIAGSIIFAPLNTEKMRLSTSGNLQVQGQIFRYDGQTVVGGSFTNLTSIDMSSSRTYLIQMIPTNVEATLGYRIFGVLQGNATSSTYTFVSLASQTMEVQFSGTTVQARVTNGQQWTFNWTITQLL